jgi:hypothetical protein
MCYKPNLNIYTLPDQAVDPEASFLSTDFAKQEAKLKAKNLPAIILERHQKMVAHYKANTTNLINETKLSLKEERRDFLDKVKAFFSEDPEVVKETSPFKNADPEQFEAKGQDFDPKNLPSKTLQPDLENNKPKRDINEFLNQGMLNTPLVTTAALGEPYTLMLTNKKQKEITEIVIA